MKTAEQITNKIISEAKKLLEAPISNMDLVGDFELGKETSFPDVDKIRLKNEKFKQKIFRAFAKTPFVFKIVFMDRNVDDSDGMEFDDIGHAGTYSSERFGIKPDSRVITAIIIHNHSFGNSDHMPITPWIVAHKIGHGLIDNNKPVDTQLWSIINKMGDNFDQVATYFTFKSASKQYTTQYEIGIELVAQYLIQGKIILATKCPNKDFYEKLLNDFFFNQFKTIVGKILVSV